MRPVLTKYQFSPTNVLYSRTMHYMTFVGENWYLARISRMPVQVVQTFREAPSYDNFQVKATDGLPSIKERFRIVFQNCRRSTLKMSMCMWKGRKTSCEMQGFLSSSFYPPSKVVFIKKMIYGRRNWTQ